MHSLAWIARSTQASDLLSKSNSKRVQFLEKSFFLLNNVYISVYVCMYTNLYLKHEY